MSRSRSSLQFAACVSVLCMIAGCANNTNSVQPTTQPSSSGATSQHELTSGHAEATNATFPRHDARTALHAAEDGLRSCKRDGSPASLNAALTFESTGKVSKVDVTPASSETAACIHQRLSEVTIPAFSGDSVTMRMPIHL